MFAQPVVIAVNGQLIDLNTNPPEPLVRAVVISLLTWRRANPDDVLPADARMGWWGDSLADVPGDRIGSRLWLLARENLTAVTVSRAREYCAEALQWLIDDGVAVALDVQAERVAVDRLGIVVTMTRSRGAGDTSIRFDNVWGFINAV
jgi:phage gp46-like protein